MTERKLLIHGDVVTMNARFECIEDGAVLIKGKRIEAVGKPRTFSRSSARRRSSASTAPAK